MNEQPLLNEHVYLVPWVFAEVRFYCSNMDHFRSQFKKEPNKKEPNKEKAIYIAY